MLNWYTDNYGKLEAFTHIYCTSIMLQSVIQNIPLTENAKKV